MTLHRETRSVPYSADAMYAVVADVARYPEFLPWVVGLRILSREGDMLVAEMLVSFGPFREKYTSRIALDPIARRIDVTAVKGPFRRLHNEWQFESDGDGCRIEFAIDFEFRNPLLQAAARGAFEKALLKMTDAFIARAAATEG